MKDWIFNLPWNLISEAAQNLHLDRKLVGAICHVESDGISATTRFEPTYRYLYFPERYAESLMITSFTEENAQKTSYGLLQLMGGVARELGYADYLSRLVEPKLGLEFGCRKLAAIKQKYGDVKEDIAAAYNHGSAEKLLSGMYFNQKYVDAVMSAYRDISA